MTDLFILLPIVLILFGTSIYLSLKLLGKAVEGRNQEKQSKCDNCG